MQMLVDIPEEQIQQLDTLASKARRSRDAEIRDAIERHLRKTADDSWIYGEGFGYWKDRDDIGDPLEYQRSMREDRNSD